MTSTKKQKAQTSIEVLLLLGGAILIAIIVGMTLKNIGSTVGNQAINQISCTGLNCDECKKITGCTVYLTGLAPVAADGSACSETQKTLFETCKAG